MDALIKWHSQRFHNERKTCKDTAGSYHKRKLRHSTFPLHKAGGVC